ncbi:MAG: hypothetical protein Q4D96_06810 [Propionibacteriaceae bacterium]|nr:hypothetical protein [Propionibacteriaceae bacterium]
MSRRLPDEYFRQTPGEPQQASPETTTPAVPVPSFRAPSRTRGMPVVLVVACALATFLIGFAGVRSVLLHGQAVSPTSPASAASTQTRAAVPHTGRVRPTRAVVAESTCADGTDPGQLLDGSAETIWTCPGNAREESITFYFEQPVELVGVRLLAGDAGGAAAARQERRIMAVSWTFEDGSWVSQPLGNSGAPPQELRFPGVETSMLKLTVASVSEPGGLDQVSISNVEFLTPM